MAFFKKTLSAQFHLVGCVGAIVGMIVLLGRVSLGTPQNQFWACLLFGTTSVLVFGISSLYHFLHDGFGLSPKWAERLENLDHFAIYLFIAGSYTAVLLNTIANPWANILLAAVWAIAFVGILYTCFKSRLPLWAQHRYLYTGLFVGMGCLIVIRVGEVVHKLSQISLLTPFLLGVSSYILGAIIYATKWPKLFHNIFGFHEIWHTLVVAGYCFHFYMIFNFYVV